MGGNREFRDGRSIDGFGICVHEKQPNVSCRAGKKMNTIYYTELRERQRVCIFLWEGGVLSRKDKCVTWCSRRVNQESAAHTKRYLAVGCKGIGTV